ncbi:MAG: type II secretion system F family protein [Acidobacteriaceae bacterium]|jgi:type IV pilus assembly protein PilC|nr:type II secretion system F family protein [Acidobacteriaceae bacterium]
MATFAYSGRRRTGERVNGERVAETARSAVAALRAEQIVVTKIAPVRTKADAKGARGSLTKKVASRNLAIFTRQFAVMIDAGLPLVQCLDILGHQEENTHFSAVILETRRDVEAGASLADAMKKHPNTFDALYTNMVAAGEAGGVLDTMLTRLAIYIEKAVTLAGQVRSAMVYPIAVLTIAVLVVAVILWKVIPTFTEMFASLGAELPLPTRLVIGMSHMLTAFFPVIAAGVLALVVACRAYYRTSRGRRVVDRMLLALPILGVLLRKIAVARFCRTLATLLGSGVPILDGLNITARTSGNAMVEDAILSTRRSIERGETIAAPLRETKVFPPMVVQMIGVGEATGALDVMLAKIADFYEGEVDTAVAGLLTLLEPVMIAILGLVVGGIVVAMYLPIFDLIGKLA